MEPNKHPCGNDIPDEALQAAFTRREMALVLLGTGIAFAALVAVLIWIF